METTISFDRQVFCNRTLNLRAVRAIGYDMDYTLIHYRVEEWERRAYDYLKESFLKQGLPVQHLEFDPNQVGRGVTIDTENGNLLKANRFGFVKRGTHGTRAMDFETQRKMYSRTIIDLSEKRWVFLNTLFSLSEGCMYSQLVDLLDEHKIPGVLGYSDLYEQVRLVLETAHLEGRLKAEIISNPDRFVVPEPEVPLALLDQHYSGKKLMLITNSEWSYTASMMEYAFDRFLPKGMKWRDLFDLIIVGARKPNFFNTFQPFFEVVTHAGLLKPTSGKLQKGVAYLGGSARQVEETLGLSGDEILYVGDHMFGDVHVTKNVLRWRTALIIRELEEELQAVQSFRAEEEQIAKLMREKEELESQFCKLRLEQQRMALNYGSKPKKELKDPVKKIEQLKAQIAALDEKLAPLAKRSGELNNKQWGLLMRAGNDKSYLAYQMERYADVYTSRVANLLALTPFAYLRSARGSLPHDPGIRGETK